MAPTETGQETNWTVGRLLTWMTEYFKGKGLEEPTLSAQLLLTKVLACTKVELYLRYEEVIDRGRRDELRDLVRRAGEGEPIAYLVGHKEFFSLDFVVDPTVLIPRPETELLVQWVVRKARADHPEGLEILDIGTGSGCIAIALAKYLPHPPRILAIDRSPEILDLASRNAHRHGVQDRIHFMVGDLFEPIEPGRQFHFIVSNPPYVTEEDYARLPKSIKDYEPRGALVGGPDGLSVIGGIVVRAGVFLKPGGYLAMEIGYNQAVPVSELLAEHGLAEITFERDLAGVPRVAIGKRR